MAEDLKQLMSRNFLTYASYVILERAIPGIDGLKPVQRRILYTLHGIDDGKFHKVANVVGQTMALHPHGDAPINDALVNLATKGYLLDTQGNFGNLHTGDPASAARYIETRLSPIGRETLFNKALTSFTPSYDARNQEPLLLPVKIPLLLMQGAEGIAVGMSTRILPHNFCELLKAEIAILEEKKYKILPDLPTGGIMDASEYDQGRGRVKLRAKLETPDDKTIIIREICFGTTTESTIRSIDEAAKKGKIKIDSINDYTADKVEIEIKLPRGQYADKTLDALYAFTDCEVSLNSQVLLIKDNLPWEGTVNEVLETNVSLLKHYLQRELEIEQDALLEKIYQKTLEQIFIENRLYKEIENLKTYENIHSTIAAGLKPFHKKLPRIPNEADRERLLNILIRRISRFDIDKHQKEIEELENRLKEIEKHLKDIKKFTINYIEGLLKKYGKSFPRRTEIDTIEEVDVRSVARRNVKVGIDLENGFVGTKVSSSLNLECTNFDKILLIFKDGTYKVSPISEKDYAQHEGHPLVYAGIADKKSVFRVVYKDSKAGFFYVKRFIVNKFILNKWYHFLPEKTSLEHMATQENLTLHLTFKAKAKQKMSTLNFALDSVAIKGVSAKGIRVSNKEVKSFKMIKPADSES